MGNTVDRYKILNEISSVISQSLDLEEILCSALEQVLLAADLDTGGIYLFDEKSKLLKVAAHHGFEPDFIKEIDNLKYGEGFSGLVMEKGQPLVIRDISQEKRLSRSIVNEAGLTSLVVVPVCSKQKTLGTLFLISHDLRDFDDQEVQLLISAGQQIGVAVDNAFHANLLAQNSHCCASFLVLWASVLRPRFLKIKKPWALSVCPRL